METLSLVNVWLKSTARSSISSVSVSYCFLDSINSISSNGTKPYCDTTSRMSCSFSESVDPWLVLLLKILRLRLMLSKVSFS